MEEKQIWIVGHKNPDTDSICAAIAYADYKNQLQKQQEGDGEETFLFVPKRAGELNAETAYVLHTFGVTPPDLVTDVGTQIKDIAIRKTEGVSGHISMKKAWEMMQTHKVVTLPVVNAMNKLEGLIVTGDIAKSYMDVYDTSILSTARTQYKSIAQTLDGRVVSGNSHGYFVRGKVVIAVGSRQLMAESVEHDDLVIMGDLEESQILSIAEGCSCMIVTNGYEVSQKVLEAAAQQDVVVISTPYDTFTTARLINQSNYFYA